MKAILLSIRPEWCKKILSGEKTTEIRKSRPNLETPFKVYIYCTKIPDWLRTVSHEWQRLDRKVIGEFICDKVWELAPLNRSPDDIEQQACMDRDAIVRYLNKCHGWAWHISDLKIYDQPRKLRAFTGLQSTRFGMRPVEITRPPQSWRYVEDNK